MKSSEPAYRVYALHARLDEGISWPSQRWGFLPGSGLAVNDRGDGGRGDERGQGNIFHTRRTPPGRSWCNEGSNRRRQPLARGYSSHPSGFAPRPDEISRCPQVGGDVEELDRCSPSPGCSHHGSRDDGAALAIRRDRLAGM